MTPIEFIIQMNGIATLYENGPPSPEHWDKIRELLSEVVGKLAADKLLEQAYDQHKRNQQALEYQLESFKQAALASSFRSAIGLAGGQPQQYKPAAADYRIKPGQVWELDDKVLDQHDLSTLYGMNKVT